MGTYNGIFMRSTLGQTNTIPKPGALSSSPDIIPYGIAPVSDPQTFFRDNYNQDVGKKLEAGKTNYIYVRGKNYSDKEIRCDGTDTPRPRLFWSKASLLTYPNKWNEIKEGPTHEGFSLIAPAASIGVINQPYVWVPDNISGDHYCMIGQVPSPGYDNKIPDTLQIADFAGWVAQNGGIAWRNIEVINASTVVLTGAKMYYEQGTEASQIQFTIICTNVPKGTKVSFSAGAAGPVPPIYLEPTVVSTYPSFTTGVVCSVPKNYESNIYFNLEAPAGTPNLNDATVQIQAAYPMTPSSANYHLGYTNSELGVPNVDEAYARIMRDMERSGGRAKLEDYHEMYLSQLEELVKGGPTRLTVVGAMNFDWKK